MEPRSRRHHRLEPQKSLETTPIDASLPVDLSLNISAFDCSGQSPRKCLGSLLAFLYNKGAYLINSGTAYAGRDSNLSPEEVTQFLLAIYESIPYSTGQNDTHHLLRLCFVFRVALDHVPPHQVQEWRAALRWDLLESFRTLDTLDILRNALTEVDRREFLDGSSLICQEMYAILPHYICMNSAKFTLDEAEKKRMEERFEASPVYGYLGREQETIRGQSRKDFNKALTKVLGPRQDLEYLRDCSVDVDFEIIKKPVSPDTIFAYFVDSLTPRAATDPVAAFRLGMIYTKKNPTKACDFFTVANNLGHPLAGRKLDALIAAQRHAVAAPAAAISSAGGWSATLWALVPFAGGDASDAPAPGVRPRRR